MANPNIVSLTSLTFDNNDTALTSATATIVPGVASGTVELIDNIVIAGLASCGVTISRGTAQILDSMSLTGQTTEQISGPIVLTEGEYMTGKASANSSAVVTINKRVMS